MKKIILTLGAIVLALNVFAQKTPVYVVFTSTDLDANQGVWRYDDYFDYTVHYHHLPLDFTIINRAQDYGFDFEYVNYKEQPDDPIITKPSSFLNTVSYIDWDVIGPGLTKTQAKAKFEEILSHSPIYFIDRKDTKNGTMKLVPVKDARAKAGQPITGPLPASFQGILD